MLRVSRFTFLAVLGAVVLLALTGRIWFSKPSVDSTELQAAGIVLLPEPRPLPALALTNTEGKAQTLNRATGRWTLVFFGYTFCPDICPTTLAELRQLDSLLPASARARYQVVMVSVDPHRDTPEQLGRYLGFFNAGYQGLTGALADIQTLAAATGIPFIPGDTQKERYTVDHSGNLALIGPDGLQYGFLRAPLNVQELAKVLPEFWKNAEKVEKK